MPEIKSKVVEMVLVRGASFVLAGETPFGIYQYRNVNGAECFFASYDIKGADFTCVPANKQSTVKLLWSVTNGVEPAGRVWLDSRPPVDLSRFPAAFRERPQEVKAIQVRRDNMAETKEFLGPGMRVMVEAGGFQFGPVGIANTLHAQIGDWIVSKQVAFDVMLGGYEVLNNDEFRRRYVRV